VQAFNRRQLALIAGSVVALLVIGTVGFRWALGETWFDAFYRTVVSASLTGLDTTPHTTSGELLTVAVVLSGVAVFGYFAAQIVDAVTHGVLRGVWRENKKRKMLAEIRDHIIVCGYGRVGRRAAEEFRAGGVPYVVLDFGEEALAFAEENGDLWVDGNGADDGDLARAGIDRARGLLVAADDDADNMYIVLSAKARRPDLVVIARASSEEAERKLKLAGADRVVTPYTTAGRVMANLMTKPQVTALVSTLTSSDTTNLSFEEIEVQQSCGAVGSTIGELEVGRKTGAYIVAVRKLDGHLKLRPSKETVLGEGDVIVGIGSPDEIGRLEQLFEPRAAGA